MIRRPERECSIDSAMGHENGHGFSRLHGLDNTCAGTAVLGLLICNERIATVLYLRDESGHRLVVCRRFSVFIPSTDAQS
jgi:hypothetical protein